MYIWQKVGVNTTQAIDNRLINMGIMVALNLTFRLFYAIIIGREEGLSPDHSRGHPVLKCNQEDRRSLTI
jgi:hypothetical protein